MRNKRNSGSPIIWSGLGKGNAAAFRDGLVSLAREHLAAKEITKETSRFSFRNKSASTGIIDIRGPIGADFFGDGITSDNFTKELRGLGDVKTIDLYIDSPGGSVPDAQAIYLQLVQHAAKVNVTIDGFALSAASYIAMAGDTISIGEGSFMMIHNARGVAFGEAADMRKSADILDGVTNAIARTYVSRTGLSKSAVADMMDAETWMDGAEAVDQGFATDLIPNKTQAKAMAYASAFGNMPSALLPRRAEARRMLKQVDELLAAQHRS